MPQDIAQAIRLDCQNDFLKRDLPASLQLLVLLVVPTKGLHTASLSNCVPFVTTLDCRSRLTARHQAAPLGARLHAIVMRHSPPWSYALSSFFRSLRNRRSVPRSMICWG